VLTLGPVFGALAGLCGWLLGLPVPAAATVGVTAWCATWWTTEPVPIPATSLLPFVILPWFGALPGEAAARAFGHDIVLLLMGGYLLSTAMEKSGAHERLAVGIVRAVRGTSGWRILLGFATAGTCVSAWISNTATTLMLLPVALAVTGRSNHPERLGGRLLLVLAWSASIGGLCTPVGTTANPLLVQALARHGVEWGFFDWGVVAVPVVAVLVPFACLWLARGGALTDVQVTLPDLGPWSAPATRTLVIFGVTALSWVTRTAPFGGWRALLGVPDVGDHTVALLMVVVGFVTPNGAGGRVLDWDTAKRIPWGLLLLIAGGLAIGEAFDGTGLDDVVAARLGGAGALPVWLSVGAVAIAVTFLTEFTSNTAVAALILPILGTAAVAAGLRPELWLVPAGLSASCAFMLPVGTAPNAIVVGSGYVPTRFMAREGFVLNLVGAAVITAVTLALV
jgi:sodium-dependent dicarboxylate transporter 2/3/5